MYLFYRVQFVRNGLLQQDWPAALHVADKGIAPALLEAVEPPNPDRVGGKLALVIEHLQIRAHGGRTLHCQLTLLSFSPSSPPISSYSPQSQP